MDEKYCPKCSRILTRKNDGIYNYDPILSVEVISYSCPACGYEEEIEQLKQVDEQA